MYILGIDISLNSPGFCILNTKSKLSDFNYFLCGGIKKFSKDPSYNLIIPPYKERKLINLYKQQEIKTFTIHLINKFDIRYAAIEGYSFMSSGSGVYQLGEIGGIIRNILFEKKIPFKIYEPSLIKLAATGKGNAKKDFVRSKLLEIYPYLDIFDRFNAAKFDLYDSYIISIILYHELQIRTNKLKLEDLPSNIIKVMCHTFPKKKITLLEENFLGLNEEN